MPSTPRFFRLSKNDATRSALASLNSVQLILVRKPRALAARMAETSECLQNGLSHGGRLHVQQYGIAAPQARNGKSTHRVMHPSPISLKISLFHLSFQMNPAHHQFAECETLLHLHLADHLQLLSGESEGEGWFLGLVADSGRWYVFPFDWFTGFV